MKKCLVCGTELVDFCITDVCGECVLKYIEQHKKETNHRNMIETELAKAKTNHPNFCRGFTTHEVNIVSIAFVKNLTNTARSRVEIWGKSEDILDKEKLEAVEAYLEGRLEDCLVELAQCGAVVLRMMEFVQAEIDAKKGQP